ncbi:MAG: hypothetical protein IIA64_12605, partial [Planctomycetes bacterium]|nr:hypothetical protein [Planctomycetota bacterium]
MLPSGSRCFVHTGRMTGSHSPPRTGWVSAAKPNSDTPPGMVSARHASTARNLATLKKDGIHIVGPNDGDMACGEYGPGRMAEPEEILAAAQAVLSRAQRGALSGLKALVTAGPTHEPIDPVRYISNYSSGKMG